MKDICKTCSYFLRSFSSETGDVDERKCRNENICIKVRDTFDLEDIRKMKEIIKNFEERTKE